MTDSAIDDTATDTDIAAALRTVLDGRWADVRDQARRELADSSWLPDPSLTLQEARDRVLGQLQVLAKEGVPKPGFTSEQGGTGDVGAAITAIEMLGYADLSLMVKAGVQWGLFGGAIAGLGTERHFGLIPGLIDLSVLGCFAMTETGHGSNVQQLETTAHYDADTEEFVIHSPTPSSRKDYIGGAAEHARVAAVFAQLITAGPGAEPEDRGVHCFVVPIRDDAGADLPGVTTSDCGYKGGLRPVDNGRIMFDHVRVPRTALLNRYADVEADGTYVSPIENDNKRFFTMLGTLIRGRVAVGAASGAASRKALAIAIRYGLGRRQFEDPATGDETLLLDYRMHQRRLLPLLARSYAFALRQNEVVAELHEVQSSAEVDPVRQRQLEAEAASNKAAATWHSADAIQTARECCGGAGYMAANQLSIIRDDHDVFTTFEGDNLVLTQLVAKEQLTAFADEMHGLNAAGWAKFVADTARSTFLEKSAARQIVQTLLDDSDENFEESQLTKRGVQLRMFGEREDHLLRSAAQRMRRANEPDEDAFEVFNNAQGHIIAVGEAHAERVALEAFVDALHGMDEGPAKDLLRRVCDLYVYATLEKHLSWYLSYRMVSVERAKAIRRGVNELCAELRPHARTLVDAFGIPEQLLATEMPLS
jgi:acyl-CoA oxidase